MILHDENAAGPFLFFLVEKQDGADGLLELACNYSSDSHHNKGSDELSPNKTNDLSDEYEEIKDDGPAVVSETPKSFLPELKLQAYFSSSAKQPSIEEKVNHAITISSEVLFRSSMHRAF